MADLPTLDWQPSEDGGWRADIGVLWFAIDEEPMTVTCGWAGDFTTEPCDSFEDGKRKAAKIAREILQQAIDAVDRSGHG